MAESETFLQVVDELTDLLWGHEEAMAIEGGCAYKGEEAVQAKAETRREATAFLSRAVVAFNRENL